ncbi:MAG: N-acetyltransferase [Rhodocyclaceae bacterium]|nr:N-acetyltransferase [Rhodocyclaceae bacterium]
MSHLTLRTDRLKLIAATRELLETEGDLTQLAQGLQAEVPSNWPMPLYDSDARSHFLRVVSENPEAVGWTTWYILLAESTRTMTLVGAVGACGLPDVDGTIVIGYSILDQFQGKGYATEALCGFLKWARQHPRLRRVFADTYPRLVASIRVLERNGFIRCGKGTEEGTIGFELLIS